MSVRSNVPVRIFLKRSMIKSVVILLVYALQHQEYYRDYQELGRRVSQLMKLSGTKCTINYLKECSRVLVRWLANQDIGQLKVPVKLSHSGLPMIIPGKLRYSIQLLRSGHSTTQPIRVIRGVLTLLQLWRGMRVKGILPNFGTITDPFKGSNESLHFRISQLMPSIRFERKGAKWSISETSGPNSPFATYGSLVDAFAFITQPLVGLNVIRLLFAQGSYGLGLWLYGLMLCGLVWYPICKLLGSDLVIGRISHFEEGGGKVRVIGVIDAWSQMALHRTHDYLYDILKRIPQDGTFNQTKPLHKLMDVVRLNDATVYSFDLSAATDRLPLKTQLNALSSLGCPWASLVGKVLADRKWWSDIGYIRYSVGQPMGAYSSWALLAVTHHMIVQEAAYAVGYRRWFTNYALLGDDIIIAEKSVADAYCSIMSTLGVEINMGKSVIGNNGFCEFAKRWVHPHLGEFSPIGIKLLMGIVKNITMYPVLLVEMAQKAFPLYPSSVKAVLSSLYKIRSIKPNKPKDRNLYEMLVFAAMAPGGLLKHGHMITDWLNVWITDALGISKIRFVEAALYSPFLRDQIEESERVPRENWEFFKNNYLKVPVLPKNKLLSWLLKPMIALSPGPWFYGIKIKESLERPFSAGFNLAGLFTDPEEIKHLGLNMSPQDPLAEGSLSLSALGDFVDLYDIDYSKRGVASRHTLALSKFYKAIHLADAELNGPKCYLLHWRSPKVYHKALSTVLRETSLVSVESLDAVECPSGRGLITPESGIADTHNSLENAAPLLGWSSSEDRELRRAVG